MGSASSKILISGLLKLGCTHPFSSTPKQAGSQLGKAIFQRAGIAKDFACFCQIVVLHTASLERQEDYATVKVRLGLPTYSSIPSKLEQEQKPTPDIL